MFASESEMTRFVAGWINAGGMNVREEFVTPWGICDLVGLSFNKKKVAKRLNLQQTRAVGSITRAVLLLEIPDSDTGRSTTLDTLVRRCAPWIPEEVVSKETTRLVADRFVVSGPRGRLQRVNGWMPLHKRLVAVELKMSRIEQAMRQALNNMGFADESYVGLPCDVARRVAAKPWRRSEFLDAGLGLLSVGRGGCRVLIRARADKTPKHEAIQLYCVEKFWRGRVRGN